jgi:hypothetical protein
MNTRKVIEASSYRLLFGGDGHEALRRDWLVVRDG